MAFLLGSNADDLLLGSAFFDLVLAFDGDDNIFSGAGTDVIVAGAGDDFIDGGADGDVIMAGDGNDTILWDGGDQVVDGGRDIDTILANGQSVNVSAPTQITNMEVIDLVEQIGLPANSVDGDAALGNGTGMDALQVWTMTDAGNSLTIEGNIGDTVELEADGANAFNRVGSAGGYEIYQGFANTQLVEVWVDVDMNVNLV